MPDTTKDEIAFDRGMRSIDHDGRLRVELTPISKAMVCPYYGREIPNAAALGLDQEKVYYLFRDPIELQLAAETSNGIPLMEEHIAVTPDSPAQTSVIGFTGTDGVFQSPYLMNSLVVTVRSAIDMIESGQKKQLSCAYHYDADMKPGIFQGVKYDGVMRNIRMNHIALVLEGRAGPDVLVADSLPPEFSKENDQMTIKNIATDELDKAGEDEWEDDKDAKAKAKDKKSAKDKAKDDDMEDVSGMDDCDMDKAEDSEAEEDDDDFAKKKVADKKARDKKARDKKAAMDAEEDDDDKESGKKAMDAAMATVARETEKRIRESMRSLREAEDLVRPVVGNLLACDSAEEVYEVLFKHQNVDFKDMPVQGYRSLAKVVIGQVGARKQQNTVVAMDHSAAKTFATRFPNVAKIKNI
jgi:hypothetical protein